jgi:hypothetical protein
MTKPARDEAAAKDAWIQERLGERKYRQLRMHLSGALRLLGELATVPEEGLSKGRKLSQRELWCGGVFSTRAFDHAANKEFTGQRRLQGNPNQSVGSGSRLRTSSSVLSMFSSRALTTEVQEITQVCHETFNLGSFSVNDAETLARLRWPRGRFTERYPRVGHQST